MKLDSTVPYQPDEQIINEILLAAKEQLTKALEQMVKHHHYKYALLDLKNTFKIQSENISNAVSSYKCNDSISSKLSTGAQRFEEQLTIYEHANFGNEKNDQLIKLCDIARDHFHISVSERYILEITSETL